MGNKRLNLSRFWGFIKKPVQPQNTTSVKTVVLNNLFANRRFRSTDPNPFHKSILSFCFSIINFILPPKSKQN